MKVELTNFNAKGTVSVPSSKSVIHRELIMAFLSMKDETIKDITYSNDVNATLNALINMGANCVKEGDSITFKKPNNIPEYCIIDCNESGSTLRFLIPVASSLIKHTKFIGKESLFKRPLSIYEEILDNQNIKYEKDKDYLEIFDYFKANDFTVRGDISSQFISGLLLMYAAKRKTYSLKVLEPFESKEYVDITLDSMKRFGYIFDFQNNTYSFKEYKEQGDSIHYAEKDYSQAAFFLCLGAINGEITLTGMNPNSLQGDKKIIDILKSMGANITVNGDEITVKKSDLKPIEIDLKSIIDSGPILFALSALINGRTHIKNIRRLRIKESDRVLSMKEELEKFGVKMEVNENDCYIDGKDEYSGDHILSSHNDHRIVMALSVFSSLVKGVTTIEGAEAINKSYISFFDDFIKIGGDVNVKE